MSTLFITAYKDIGRSKWSAYQRDQSNYIHVFTKMALEISKHYTLLVYVSNEVKQQCEVELQKLTGENVFPERVIFIALSSVPCFLDKYIDKEKDIIQSQAYKHCIPWDRKDNPEHCYAEYNLINHSKINFVADAKRRYDTHEYYVWVDFGLKDYPSKELAIATVCPKGKIVYGLLTPLPPYIVSPKQMLASHTIFFMGSEFVAHRDAVNAFESAFESTLCWLHEQNVSDDDQNVVLQVYFKYPHLFHCLQIGEWFSMFRRFLNK